MLTIFRFNCEIDVVWQSLLSNQSGLLAANENLEEDYVRPEMMRSIITGHNISFPENVSNSCFVEAIMT